MNSYNDNLNSSVLELLQSQELDQKNKKAQLNAAMFSLYYAQGATITATEKLELSIIALSKKSDIKAQAVISKTISTNLLASANQVKAYVGQSVTNAAVAAANVQVAANAILKLAGDMGSIYSIINAGDFGTDIYDQSKEAHRLMDITAWKAEKASEKAMMASSLTAQISAPMLADKAKSTDVTLSDLLDIISLEYDAISEKVNADNTALADANIKEKAAEGVLEDLNTDYYASSTALASTNKQLNLNLMIPQKSKTSNSYTVCFDALKSPFETKHEKPNYPIEQYYVMVVKESKKAIFNINSAEQIILKEEDLLLYKKVFSNDSLKELIPSKMSKEPKTFLEVNLTIDQLNDADDEAIVRGSNYVVFVMANYDDEYKREINNFEDYLSAPSAPFNLTYKLESPAVSTFNINSKNPKIESTFNFEIEKSKNANSKVEYRCIFLPADPEITHGLLTDNALRLMEQEKENGLDLLYLVDDKQPSLFLNKSIAENISAGCYYKAKQSKTKDASEMVVWEVKMGSQTTDNYGNPLISGNQYIPVVLTMSTEPKDKLIQYTNVITDYINTPAFQF